LFTLITAWVTEKIVAVMTISLVAVAAVPTTLVLTTEHQTTVVLQQQQQQQQIVLIATVKKAGDDLVIKLQSAGTACTNQVTQLVATSKVTPGSVQSQVAQANLQIKGSIAPFIAATQQEQIRFAKMAVITPEDEESELEHLKLISVTALGAPQIVGVVTITCQTVVIEVQQIIEVIVVKEPKAKKADID
jgi:hypothetical protein